MFGGKYIMSKLERLEELIRTAADNLLTKEEKIGYIADRNLTKVLVGKFPKCFIILKRVGIETDDYHIPICNRAGLIDPSVINISQQVITKMMSEPSGKYDINDLQIILDKLNRLHSRYNKEIPKPPVLAARKATVTRMFNNIKNHLRTIK